MSAPSPDACATRSRDGPRPRGRPPLTGDTCRNGHPYEEGSYSWQRSGAGYLSLQCNRCNADRRKRTRARSAAEPQ